jgi:hypothetical protein
VNWRGSAGRRWTVRDRLVGGFVVAYVAAQVVIPALALTNPQMSRFGWQMYAKMMLRTSYAVVHADGAVEEIDPTAHVALSRAEVELERFLPPHLCRTVPDATAVRVRSVDGGAMEVACP